MIAVLVISDKPDKPVIKKSDGVLISWKMMIQREIVNTLLFEDTDKFYAWMQTESEWEDRYPGCDFEIHRVEDMLSFTPLCRYCYWFDSAVSRGICTTANIWCKVDENTRGCEHFERGN